MKNCMKALKYSTALIASNTLPQVDLLKSFMKDNLNKEDDNWMRFCCLAMDTNAYEFLRVLDDGTITNLRGLYPLAAIMNHDCSPNTSHHYDRNGVMKVKSPLYNHYYNNSFCD